ncbi:MAG: hypothetical protein HWE27_00485 [Gammaproteobacteria bacterium]|nr:hypothetical protein [Gammaproteobacteria bacterium]
MSPFLRREKAAKVTKRGKLGVSIMNMKYLTLAFLLSFSETLLSTDFNLPDNGSFTIKKSTHPEITEFEGVAVVSGTYIFKWEHDHGGEYLSLKLKLDEKSKSHLPSYKDHEIRVLTLSKPEYLASKLLSKEVEGKLLSQSLAELSGYAKLKVANLSSAVDCNVRWYMVDVIKVFE